MKFANIKKIHLVGIGGIGMSGIAEILINQGFYVSGSDLVESEVTDRLKQLGATITSGHNKANIQACDVVVYSSAVPQDNPEIQAAKQHGIPTIRRAEMLAEITRLHNCIAIAGTHGKTTTTSMLGLILIQASMDPTVIVGGKLHAFGGTNARLGKGEFMVVEADEYDRSFLQLTPSMVALTSLEAEHLDIYTDLADLQEAFIEFANKVPFYGFISICIDDPVLQEIRPHLTRKIVTFGLSNQADYQAVNAKYNKAKTSFELKIYGEQAGTVELNMPGEYNVKNALASISIAHQMGISISNIVSGLRDFTGAYRRFDIREGVNGLVVVDDYAHHPTEASEALKGVRLGWSNRVVCVFQPHTYSRTKEFYQDFGKAFMNTDLLVVTDVYPAREKSIQGVTGKLIVDAATQFGHKHAVYCERVEDVPEMLVNTVQKDDIIIFMGAGDIYKQITAFVEEWNSKVPA